MDENPYQSPESRPVRSTTTKPRTAFFEPHAASVVCAFYGAICALLLRDRIGTFLEVTSITATMAAFMIGVAIGAANVSYMRRIHGRLTR